MLFQRMLVPLIIGGVLFFTGLSELRRYWGWRRDVVGAIIMMVMGVGVILVGFLTTR